MARQLLALQQSFAGADAATRGQQSTLLYQVTPRLLQLLARARTSESPSEVDSWRRLLLGKAVLWVGGHFVEPPRVSFTAVPGLDAEPYLFSARGDLEPHRDLLLFFGAKPHFDASKLSICSWPRPLTHSCSGDYLAVLGVMEKAHRGSPLSAYALELSFRLAHISTRPPVTDTEGPSSPSDGCDVEEYLSANDLGQGLSGAMDAEAIPNPKAPVDLSMYWPVSVPDQQGILVPSTCLCFNDAPWIPAAALTQLSQRGSSLLFVHREIDNMTAAALGVRSLREQLFAGDEMVCPGAASLRALLAGESLSSALGGLLSLGEAWGSNSLHVVYDARHHPQQSLMHPGLAALQGPAVVVYMEGVQMGAEGILQVILVISYT